MIDSTNRKSIKWLKLRGRLQDFRMMALLWKEPRDIKACDKFIEYLKESERKYGC